jgi:hypothetical protein
MRVRNTWFLGLAGAGLAFGGAVAGELSEQSVALPQDVVYAATAFQGWMTRAAAIDPGFKDGPGVGKGLEVGASYEARQFEQGMIAYGAIAALRNDAFVAGVADAASSKGPEALSAQLIADPSAVTKIGGADEAARVVTAALDGVSTPLIAAGAQVKAASYSIQHEAWSTAKVADPQGRAAEMKTLSATPSKPADAAAAAMAAALVGSGQSISPPAAGYSDVQVRSLALAAEAVLGHASASERDRLAPLLTEDRSVECLKAAKLDLFNCVAGAAAEYGDVYCLAQNAMTDTAQCVADAAHSRPLPATPAPQLAAQAPRPSPPPVLQLASGRTLRIDGN